jgi:Cu2+-exporting ATPase
MDDRTHTHGGDDPTPRGERPTDRECPCCRVCACYRTDNGASGASSAAHAAHDHDHQQNETGDHDHGAMVDHAGHEAMFKKRFFVSFVLALPVLYYSPLLQEWFGFTAITFPGSVFVAPALGILIFAYGGVPFLRMGAVEARNREPGMMLLISLAITVSFVYSLAVIVFGVGEPFFWELVTLIVIFLLGH